MKIAFSVPTGYHTRELLVPLKELLEDDKDVEKIICITPGAQWRSEIFPNYGKKFDFITNPGTDRDHVQLFKNIKTSIVVTNTSGLDTNDAPILRAAKVAQIPTLTFVASWDNVWKMERLQRQKRPQELADTFIVWNAKMADHILRIFPDYPHESIHVIGAPRLDFFFHEDKIPSRQQLLSYLGFSDNESKLIHFATTELYSMDYVIQAVRNAIQRGAISDKLHLYASVHPGGDIQKHRSYAKKYDVTVRYSFGRREYAPHPDFLYNPTREEIYMLVALFRHTDILINHSSTVAVESLLANTPVINVKYGRPLDWWNWYRSMVYRDFQQHYQDLITDGATSIVANSRQLIATLNDYLKHPVPEQSARQKTLAKLVSTLDGTASHKVLDCIKKSAKT